MPDITLKCTQCGKEMTVSEFVDPESLKCSDCGAPMPVPESGPSKRQKSTPTVVRRANENEAEAEKARERRRKREKRRKAPAILLRIGNFRLSEFGLSWIIFVVMGGILSAFRYSSDILDEESRAQFATYGMYAVGLVYLTVVVLILKDEMFEGILSIFVPPYGIYYLYFKSDSFYLRAIMGAFLMAFGIDTFTFIAVLAVDTFNDIDTWIRSGG